MTFPYRLEARPTPSRAMQLAVPVVAAVATLVIGFLIFSVVGQDPLRAMHAFFIDPLSSVNGWSELFLKASPLCLIGLGLAVGYRANVWNIGAEGQMLLGGIFAGGIAIHFGDASGWWTLPLMMIGGVIGGMVWAAIPALLKSRFNTNEILTSLMLTYVATQLLIYLVSGPWRDPEGMNFQISAMFVDDALFPRLYGDWHWTFLKGTRINASVFLTVIAIPCVWVFMRKSFAGFRMNVGGLAPLAARYAGFSDKKTIWTSLLLSGGLAGLAGMAKVAGPIGQLQAGWSPGYGFTAIIVVFVGRLHPVGIVLASLLMALLYLGGEAVQTSLQLPQALAGVFQGLLLFCLLGCDLFVNYRVKRRSPAHHAV
ncbi:Unspecified monosaccharide ABC transport system, permease component Ia/Ib [Candidatus Burkholderia verschuerenii]|uniref:Unspecified monosaccharide ABC transport system, permease component Ia/Ib n=1 Tax=Candidatus Burkholderia verschuerenii TaxID=242163 RepID=A0A0L0MBI1_9BURK|nr:ABC transporter permease [Candidatus Burkholderia verschuerenii]KND59718.1 Unspecified monosaccharide ABC transport system, permease component Ia/Ib [Candidatus Burkholderia verschuerenii]